VLAGDGGPVELGDEVTCLDDRALGDEGGDARLIDLGGLHVGRSLDLDRLTSAELAGGGDDDAELAGFDLGGDRGGVVGGIGAAEHDGQGHDDDDDGDDRDEHAGPAELFHHVTTPEGRLGRGTNPISPPISPNSSVQMASMWT
jgi:hypothetical protein